MASKKRRSAKDAVKQQRSKTPPTEVRDYIAGAARGKKATKKATKKVNRTKEVALSTRIHADTAKKLQAICAKRTKRRVYPFRIGDVVEHALAMFFETLDGRTGEPKK